MARWALRRESWARASASCTQFGFRAMTACFNRPAFWHAWALIFLREQEAVRWDKNDSACYRDISTYFRNSSTSSSYSPLLSIFNIQPDHSTPASVPSFSLVRIKSVHAIRFLEWGACSPSSQALCAAHKLLCQWSSSQMRHSVTQAEAAGCSPVWQWLSSVCRCLSAMPGKPHKSLFQTPNVIIKCLLVYGRYLVAFHV